MAEEMRVHPIQRRYQESVVEWFSGSSVLEEYELLEEIPRAEARRIMIRFLVAQYFTNRLRGDWAERLLRLQRSAALNAIGTGMVLDRELRLHRKALEMDLPGSAPLNDTVIAVIAMTGAMAGESGHRAGGLALLRIAYEAALRLKNWPQAASAAEHLWSLTEAEDVGSRRRWRRRYRTLQRRAQVA